jgi:hypothetical protein
MSISLRQLADRLGAECEPGTLDIPITAVSSIPKAEPGCLVFATRPEGEAAIYT